MKRILYGLFISLLMCVISLDVNAESCTQDDMEFPEPKYGNSGLTDLQKDYNTWNRSEKHSGVSCVKVIALYECNDNEFEDKEYLSGYDPKEDFLCADGTSASSKAELKASAVADPTAENDSCSSNMYVGETWEIDCSSTSSSGSSSSGNTSSGSSSSGNSSSGNSSSGSSSSGNSSSDSSSNDSTYSEGVNDKGQITGTTDAKDTGVETYFVVLIIMVMVSYVILMISKRNNLFKNI